MKMTKVLILLACWMFACANGDGEATKFKKAKRKGLAKMTFKCKFTVSSRREVTWLLNSVSVKGYPHFQVTNKYIPEKNVVDSTLKVVNPLITQEHDNYTCVIDGESHHFLDIEGMTSGIQGYGTYYFGRDGHKLNFHGKTVRKICKKWNASYHGRVRKLRNFSKREDWRCQDIKMVEVKSTVTPETAIKPIPFFSFQIRDLMNLPGNWNFKFAFNVHHELPEAVDAKEVVFEGINTTNFTFSHKDFIPNTLYDVYVSWRNPFTTESGYNQWFQQDVHSTSLMPGSTTILSAEIVENERCRITLSLPANVDANDTYTDFKPEILVNGEVAENVTRISDEIFEVAVDDKVDNWISARILSTLEKYNPDFLNPSVKCS